MTFESDAIPPKVFTPRRRRALLSFRRRGDLMWFLVSLAMFVAGATALLYTLLQLRRPLVIEKVLEEATTSESNVRAKTDEFGVPTPLSPVAVPPAAAPATVPAPVSAAPTRSSADAPVADGGLFAKSPKFQTSVDRDARLAADYAATAQGPALRLMYEFNSGEWVQAYTENPPPLHRFSRVRFSFRGEGGDNTLEFKIVDVDGSNYGLTWKQQTNTPWVAVDVPLGELTYLWGGDQKMDWSRVRSIYFAISRKPGDTGGKGFVIVRGLRFI